jgi:hypothetical protein
MVLSVVALAGWLVPLAGAQGPKPDAASVLAAARQALGGDAKLAGLKTFTVTGRTKKIQGNSLVPVEFEISCELPGKYVRKDEVPAQESAPSSSGFNGDGLIQIPPPAAPPAMPPGPVRAGAPPAPPGAQAAQLDAMRKARVTSVKQDFVKLTLGMFAASFSSYPLTFTYVGPAEAPQGKADVVEAKGAGNFTVRLFINSQTHLPYMVSWQTPVTPANIFLTTPGQPAPTTLPPGAIVVEGPPLPSATATQAERDKYAQDSADIRKKAFATAKPTENRIYYADYRDAGGFQWPFRLRRAINADTIEETTFDQFKTNTKIDPKRFEVVK